MTFEALTGSRPWLVAGWTMLHFLWVGGALGLVAAAGRRTVRKARPEVRYGFALFCLAALAVAPSAIAVVVAGSLPARGPSHDPAASVVPTLSPRHVGPPVSEAFIDAPDSGAVLARPSSITPAGGSTVGRVLGAAAVVMPWLWLGGAPATFALLATGLAGAERLRRRCIVLADGELVELARRLGAALGIARPVALGVCDRLSGPLLLGVVRPLILLPPAVLTGWSPEQLEMALLHELAHVRRFDNLVNLAQRVVESALFFHPAVWWVSAWVRLERERCCDRLVVARTGRARPYAELLASLALPGYRPGRASVALGESPVVVRIRSILNLEDDSMRLSRSAVALSAALLVAPAVLIASPGDPPPRDGDKNAAPAPAEPPRGAEKTKIDALIQRALRGSEMFNDVQGRVYFLSNVASTQARLGERDAARQTFRKAVELGRTVSFDDSRYLPHILQWIVVEQARAGFRDDAVETAKTLLRIAEAPVKRELSKVDLFPNLIRNLAGLKDKDVLREALRAGREFYTSSKEPAIRTYASSSLVNLQIQSGDLLGALRMIHDPEVFKGPNAENLRHSALFSIVGAIKADDADVAGPVLDEARRAVEANNDPIPWRRRVTQNQDLRAIAEAQARLGRFDEALKTAHSIDAERLPGQLADSAIVEFMNNQKFHKALAFDLIGEMQLAAGDRAGARGAAEEGVKTAKGIQGWMHTGYPLSQAVQILAKAGDSAAALAVADSLGPDHRVEFYRLTATSQREGGDEAGARVTLKAALGLARQQLDAVKRPEADDLEPYYRQRNPLLRTVGQLQAMLGDVKGATATAKEINDGGQRSEALRQVAADLAAIGELDKALEVVGMIGSSKGETEALEDVVRNLSPQAARSTSAPGGGAG